MSSGLCVTFYAAVFPFRRFANIIFVDAHGASPEQAAFLNSVIPLTAMFATPLFGLLVDKIGRRALLLMAGSFLLFPAFLLMTSPRVPLGFSVALLGVAFSLVPAILWPAVTYLVDESPPRIRLRVDDVLPADRVGGDGLGRRAIERRRSARAPRTPAATCPASGCSPPSGSSA